MRRRTVGSALYLVDTNILSMGAPGRRDDAGALAEWLDVRSDDLFLSAVMVAEIGDGIAKLRRTGAIARTGHLDVVLHLYGDRVMPFDVPAARYAGLLMDRARGNRSVAKANRNSQPIWATPAASGNGLEFQTALRARTAFSPPNANALDNAVPILVSRASLGTTSSAHSGSCSS